MGIALGPTQYRTVENRVVRGYRYTDRRAIRDVNMSTALRANSVPPPSSAIRATYWLLWCEGGSDPGDAWFNTPGIC